MHRPLALRLAGLVGVSLFCEIAYALITVFTLPLYLVNVLGWRPSMVGPVISTFLLMETVAKPAWGYLSDRIGRKPLIVTGIVLSGVAVFLMAHIPSDMGALALGSHVHIPRSLLIFCVLSGLNGIGGAALWPNVFASVADVTNIDERVGSMSIFNMMYMIGLGAAPVLGGLVSTYAQRHDKPPSVVFPITATFFFFALISAVALVPWLRGQAHHEEKHAESPKGERQCIVMSVLGFFMALSFFQTLGLQIMSGSIVLYLNKDLHLDEQHIGPSFIPLIAIVAGLAVPIGAWGGRWGRVKSVKLGIFLAGAGMILLPVIPSLLWFIGIGVPMIIGFLLSIPAWLAMITELSDENWRGRIYGYVATAQGVGAILGPTIGTWLFDRASHAAPFYASGVILLLTFVGAVFGLRESMKAVHTVPVRHRRA